jgi:hypothetical protein
MAAIELRVTFADRATLQREIEQNLKHGRAFLSQVAQAPVLSDCVIVLVHPEHGAELRVPAQIVMVSADGPMQGTGVELRPFNPTVQGELAAFADTPTPSAAVELPPVFDEPLNLPPEDEPPDSPPADGEADGLVDPEGIDAEAETDAELERQLADGTSIPPGVQLESKQDKLRHLSAAEQLKVARKGELADRLVVERLYGKHVWDALLHNPRITVPEVARIARKGTVPKPLLDVILDNVSWIKTPQVRRALLGNPKVSSDAIQKLLRLTPKHELKLIEKGTAYAPPVREAARKLLKQ